MKVGGFATMLNGVVLSPLPWRERVRVRGTNG
jgi:hypothetical protein